MEIKELKVKLVDIMSEAGASGIRVQFHFKPYYVSIAIFTEKFDGRDDLRGTTNVGIRDSRIEKSELLAVSHFSTDQENVDEELAEKIITSFKEAFEDRDKGVPIEEFFKSQKVREEKHQEMMAQYREKGNFTDREMADLHMFFSPCRVVAGLTTKQIRMCIMLKKFRDEQQKNYPLMALAQPSSSLMENCDDSVDRQQGLKDTLYELFMELANQSAVISA